jgi:ribosomal protein S18 acetylase RimI-like enzyme
MGGEFTIRAITEEELPQWRELRLRALKEHPEAFGSDYETARDRSFGYLIERNFGNDLSVNAIFSAFDPESSILSTVGTFGNTGKRSHIAVIWGVYTAPEVRGRGLARRLIDTALTHCRAFPEILQVHISVKQTMHQPSTSTSPPASSHGEGNPAPLPSLIATMTRSTSS